MKIIVLVALTITMNLSSLAIQPTAYANKIDTAQYLCKCLCDKDGVSEYVFLPANHNDIKTAEECTAEFKDSSCSIVGKFDNGKITQCSPSWYGVNKANQVQKK